MKDVFLKILEWIKDFIVKMFSDPKLFIIVGLTVALFFLYFNYRSVRDELENVVIEQNDTIQSYKNKTGELYSQIGTYITDIEHLKRTNTELYNEVKNLKENPIVITKVETEIVFEEKEIKDTVFVYGNGIYGIGHKYQDPFAYIDMYTDFDLNNITATTNVNSIRFPSTFKLDLIESKKGDLSFIVNTDNPYIEINNVDGVMLSPEDSKAIKKRYDKKWCLVGGVGGSLTIVNNQVKVVPALQLTFGYKIIAF